MNITRPQDCENSMAADQIDDEDGFFDQDYQGDCIDEEGNDRG